MPVIINELEVQAEGLREERQAQEAPESQAAAQTLSALDVREAMRHIAQRMARLTAH